MTISGLSTSRRRGVMLILGIAIAIGLLCLAFTANSQPPVFIKMKAGLVTPTPAYDGSIGL